MLSLVARNALSGPVNPSINEDSYDGLVHKEDNGTQRTTYWIGPITDIQSDECVSFHHRETTIHKWKSWHTA